MERRLLKRFGGLVATAAIALVLVGCKGSTGQTGTPGTPGNNGTNGTGISINTAQLTNEEWAQLTVKGTVTSVAVSATAGNPVVKFTLTDGNGTPLKGIGTWTTQSATANFATRANISFSIAKLVPGTAGSPNRWVNYIITSTPTKAAPTVWPLATPTTDAQGTLVDNGDGSYQYTFLRDITKAVDAVAAFTDAGAKLKADVDNVSFDASLIHRLSIQVGGAARGTGTTADHNANTADGSDSGVAGVLIKTPANLIYDFRPNGTAIAAADEQREITATAACNACHAKLGATFHSNTRVETRYCVICHTDQRKFGKAEATTTPIVAVTSPFGGYSGDTSRINGHAAGDFTPFIHRLHMGEELSKTGYNYGGLPFNETRYPQDKRNCVNCHSKSTATPSGDNWNTKPSRIACGACHDQVDFVAGTNHDGGSQLTDANCSSTDCHTSAAIKISHTPIYITPNNATTPAGISNFTYDIKNLTVTANQAMMKFRINLNGTPVTTFNLPTVSPVPGTFQAITNFTSGPSLYVMFAVPQDGFATPADFNGRVSVSLNNLLLPAGAAKGGTVSATADADGYWTATITGTSATPIFIPTGAKMVTASIIGSFTQVAGTGFDTVKYPTGLVRATPLKMTTASATDVRRTIVSNAKCNACHEQLGTVPNFHTGADNDANACAFCHNPNRSSSGWSADVSTYIHGIHGRSKRTVDFNWHAPTAATSYGKTMTYPGLLNECEQCHLPNTYDFSSTASQAALPNMLWSTVATGTFASTSFTASPYVIKDGATSYGSGFSFNSTTATGAATAATGPSLVNSPITSACVACHDSTLAVAHMKSNGGSFYAPRLDTTVTPNVNAFTKQEQCLLCHGNGKTADIKAVHAK